MSEILRSKIVKTSREHICFGCGRKFPKGTKMIFSVFIDDGLFNSYLCPTCREVTDHMSYYDEFCFGDLYDKALELEKE